MCLSPRWGRQLESSVWKKCFAQSLGQAKLLLVWVLGWCMKGEQCLPWLPGEHWGSFGVARAGGSPIPTWRGKGEVWELHCSAFPIPMGHSFGTPYRQERFFDCFLLKAQAQLCPELELSPGERLGSFRGTRWARGAAGPVGAARGCHRHPQITPAVSPPGEKRGVALCEVCDTARGAS